MVDIDALSALARLAGRAILEVYGTEFTVQEKEDRSPLTKADMRSHAILSQGLKELYPDIPVLSEEGKQTDPNTRSAWRQFWLVDPLDGTKEFIKRNGEFTVNIALIEQGRVVFGVVSAPVHRLSYWGGAGLGAWRKSEQGIHALKVCPARPGEPLKVVGSRSHSSPETKDWLAKLGDYELLSVGSSLKFCLLAEGQAQLYPRLGPTCEWDTAAAQAVLEGAGGEVVTLEGEPLRYSKASLLNPWFIARV